MKQKKFKIADSKKGNFPVSPHGHIEPHECPAYQPILLTQSKRFSQKILRIGDFEKLSCFASAIMILVLLHRHEN